MTRDLDRIKQLHEADARASQKQDYATLSTLMSDDAVVLPPGGKMLRGRKLLDENYARAQSSPQSIEIVEYTFDWHEVKIFGNFAYEWGYIKGRERVIGENEIVERLYHVMRILQKQPTGEWQVHRTIWNEASEQ